MGVHSPTEISSMMARVKLWFLQLNLIIIYFFYFWRMNLILTFFLFFIVVRLVFIYLFFFFSWRHHFPPPPIVGVYMGWLAVVFFLSCMTADVRRDRLLPLDDVRPFSAQCGGFEKRKRISCCCWYINRSIHDEEPWNAPMSLLLCIK